MKRTLAAIPRCLGKGLVNTVNHDGFEMAGYLAFLGLLAFFPFLVFIVSIAGFIGAADIGQEFVEFIFSNMPYRVAEALRPRVDEIISGPPQGLLTMAIIGAIWTSSSAVEGYRTILNRAYHVSTPPAYIWRRLLAIGELFLFALVVVISMMLLVLMPLVIARMQDFIGITNFGNYLSQEDNVFWGTIVLVATLSILFAAVSLFYYVVPNIKQNLSSVMPGAALTLILWIIAAWIFSFYLSHFQQVNLIYGSLGGIIAALLFFYIVNIIVIFGAEFNYLLMRVHGERIVEKEKTDTPKASPSFNDISADI